MWIALAGMMAMSENGFDALFMLGGLTLLIDRPQVLISCLNGIAYVVKYAHNSHVAIDFWFRRFEHYGAVY